MNVGDFVDRLITIHIIAAQLPGSQKKTTGRGAHPVQKAIAVIENGSLTLLILMLLCAYAGVIHGGPPLTIDDPGILDPGQWEIIVAGTASGTDNIDVYQAVLDVSYGLTRNTQVSAVMPYVYADSAGLSSHSHLGNLALGFKWRFYDGKSLQAAFAPGYAFGIVLSAALRGIGHDTHIRFLPMNFKYGLGNWTLNGEFGYVSAQDDTDGFAYGAAIGHPVGSRTQLMFELYGGADTDFDQDNLNFNIGLDYEIGAAWHLLASGGAGLREPDSRDRLNYNLFLGLQHFR